MRLLSFLIKDLTMKFLNIAALSALAVLAAAQETVAPTPTLSPQARCAQKCDAKDVCCFAECYKVPCPSDGMANDTTECVAECDQGSGSPADTKAFAECVNGCIGTHFMPTGSDDSDDSDAPTETGNDAPDSTDTDGDDEDDDSDATGTATGTTTGTTTDGAEPTDNAATSLTASSAGFLGLILAAFAL